MTFEEKLEEIKENVRKIDELFQKGETKKEVLDQCVNELWHALDHLTLCHAIMASNKPLFSDSE